jgi:hypothetical protein
MMSEFTTTEESNSAEDAKWHEWLINQTEFRDPKKYPPEKLDLYDNLIGGLALNTGMDTATTTATDPTEVESLGDDALTVLGLLTVPAMAPEFQALVVTDVASRDTSKTKVAQNYHYGKI